MRTIIVSPDPADESKNGLLLRNAIAGITDNGPSRPYLVKIEPAVYDLGSQPLALKPYVDVEGSGELTTTISSTAAIPATLVAANNSELRFVSVRATNTVALYSDGVSPRYTQVTATSSGGSFNYPIEVTGGVPLLTNVTTAGTGGVQAAGLVNFGGGSNLTAVNSSFTGSGASSVNVGLLAYGGSSTISGSVLTASGGAFAVALRVYNGTHSLIERHGLRVRRARVLRRLLRVQVQRANRDREPVARLRRNEQRLRIRRRRGRRSRKNRREPADRADRSPRSFSGHLRSLVRRQLRAAVADLRLIATT